MLSISPHLTSTFQDIKERNIIIVEKLLQEENMKKQDIFRIPSYSIIPRIYYISIRKVCYVYSIVAIYLIQLNTEIHVE